MQPVSPTRFTPWPLPGGGRRDRRTSGPAFTLVEALVAISLAVFAGSVFAGRAEALGLGLRRRP